MRFTAPWYLLLLIPATWALVVSWRQMHGIAKPRKRLAFGVRFLIVSLIVFALAGPQARRPNRGLCTIFLLDRSDSISEADRAKQDGFVDQAMRALGDDDEAGVVVFGGNALMDAAPSGRRPFGRVLTRVDSTATDVAAAMRLASASFPEGKGRRIVLLTDGNETHGDAAGAAQSLAVDQISVDTVAMGQSERSGEAAVISLEGPDEVRADQPFDLRMRVDSSVDQGATVTVDRDGQLMSKVPVHLNHGDNTVVLTQKLPDVGFHRYRATLTAPHDVDTRNNVGATFVSVKGKPKVLLAQGGKDLTLANALRRNGLVVDVVTNTDFATRTESLQPYDAILINDLNADALLPVQMKLMQSAVRDTGVGFAMVGGENSFLPGGYYGTPVADMLPVDMNIRQRKSFPSASIFIMVDASGSMGMIEDGVQKIRLAAKAAEQTVSQMSAMDRVGVAGSTDGIELVAPMQLLTDKGAVIQQIEKLSTGGGGIYIRPSMLKGEEVLKAERSKVRHFILIADGDDSEDQSTAIDTAKRMRALHITTSVVAIGTGKDVKFLRYLAAAGGGRYYLADHANKLPAIVSQDAAVMARSAIEEGAFIPKITGYEEMLRGIDSTPPLLAYCLTDDRPLARVALRTAKDDPLLAVWQYGLGTSMAFTSDAHPRWASKWVGWPGFEAFWSQAVRQISRRSTLNNYQVAVHHDGAKAQIEMKAFDRLGNPLTASNATVRVSSPTGGYHEVTLSQQGPGIFNGSFDVNELGSYIVTVAEPDNHGGQRVSSSGFSIPYPAEYRAYRTNLPLLNRVATLTGGRELKSPIEALRPLKNPGESISELWALALFWAGLLLPVDIGVRRVALPVKELLAKLWARVRAARKQEDQTVQQSVDRLHKAKERVAKPTEAPVVIPKIHEPTVRKEPVAPPTSGKSAAQSLLERRQKK